MYGPTEKLDYELEVAAVIGKPSNLGESVAIENAEEYIFGVALLNDWSGKSHGCFSSGVMLKCSSSRYSKFGNEPIRSTQWKVIRYLNLSLDHHT
jgi:hypothetical protein